MYFLMRLTLIAVVVLTGSVLSAFVIATPAALIILPILMACFIARRRAQLSALGTARWADASDLKGMTSGLIVGRMDSRPPFIARVKALFDVSLSSKVAVQQFLTNRTDLVRLSRAVHSAVFIPTGGGKGVSFVIPHLLTCPDSTVVVDFKGENARITANARKGMGHRVVILDPFRVVTNRPDTFNPLDFIDPNKPLAIDECRDLAEALVVRTGQEKEPHWLDSAEVWMAAMIAAVVHFGKGSDKSLQSVRTVLSDPAKMDSIIKLMCDSDAWNGMLSRLGHQLLHFKDKELGSTLTTTNRFMRFLDTLAIAESTKSSSFNPADLRNGKMTVYLVLPPEHMRAQSPLLRMWIGSLMRAVVRGGLQETHKVHVILDEAASLGRMEVLDDAVDKYRGYGLRLQFYFQSLGQLKKSFPDGQDQTLLSNTSQVFACVNDQQTAEYVSARLGDETIVLASGGSSRGTSYQSGENGQRSTSYSSNHNDNWNQQARRLLKPEEVMALPERIAISFMPGVPPIRTRLVRYYERDFSGGRSFKRFASVAALLFLGLMLVLAVASAAAERNRNKVRDNIDKPFLGFEQRSFERR
jgi:type IV secretion system protein VirD4